jgi:low temperature requirement protein LtrA
MAGLGGIRLGRIRLGRRGRLFLVEGQASELLRILGATLLLAAARGFSRAHHLARPGVDQQILVGVLLVLVGIGTADACFLPRLRLGAAFAVRGGGSRLAGVSALAGGVVVFLVRILVFILLLAVLSWPVKGAVQFNRC